MSQIFDSVRQKLQPQFSQDSKTEILRIGDENKEKEYNIIGMGARKKLSG